jgi:chorismate synthase
MRCPDPIIAQQMIDRVDTIRRQGNSIGNNNNIIMEMIIIT